MANFDIMSTVSWTLLGIILSGLFLGHGLVLLSNAAPASSLGLIGVITTFYALCSLLSLLAAWLIPVSAVFAAAALLTGAYTILVVAAASQLDVIRSFEWIAGVVLMVALVLTNLLAIRRVQARTDHRGR